MRICNSATMTAMNERPLSVKHQAGPIAAYVTPATAGPTAVAALNMVAFSAMAFVRSSRSTISRTNAWRAGASKAFAMPSRNASTTMCHG